MLWVLGRCPRCGVVTPGRCCLCLYCRRYCIQVKGEDRGAFCMCDRGFAGEACEAAANSCYKGCNGERALQGPAITRLGEV